MPRGLILARHRPSQTSPVSPNELRASPARSAPDLADTSHTFTGLGALRSFLGLRPAQPPPEAKRPIFDASVPQVRDLHEELQDAIEAWCEAAKKAGNTIPEPSLEHSA